MLGTETPKKKDIHLYKHNTKVKIRKFNIHAILLSNVQSICNSSFLVESNLKSHVVFRCHVSLMSLSLEKVLNICLSWSWLFFEESSQLLFGMFLNPDFSDVLSGLDSGYTFWTHCGRTPYKRHCILPGHHICKYLMSLCLIIDGVNFDYLFKTVSAILLHNKVLFSPL